ncbi:MAG: beta-ketoacyl-[acyl-carrier-protein] synthase family protein [Magnetococcus sp. THC-1_WYH]
MPNRVVITGQGCVSTFGVGVAPFLEAMITGRSGLAPFSDHDGDISFGPISGGPVRDFFPEEWLPKNVKPKHYGLFATFAMVAAQEAVQGAGLQPDDLAARRSGILVGTGASGQETIGIVSRRLYGQKIGRLHPLSIPKIMANSPASGLAALLKISGPVFTINSACASGNHAVGQGYTLIKHGVLDVAVTGGTDANFDFGFLKAWEGLGVLTPDLCRPFSKGRNGMALSEGAGIFVLENLTSAQKRGAPILAEVIGVGYSASGDDLTKPSLAAVEKAMREALDNAGLTANQVDHINAHGTGTLLNDRIEAEGIQNVFGAHAAKIAISATKALHGHAIGASSALELIAVLLALRTGTIAPTLNFLAADAGSLLDFTPNKAQHRSVQVALSNAFAFGGLNATLALRRYEENS